MEITRKSRLLVRALRHDPSSLGLTLDPRGWVSVSDVLKSLSIDKNSLDIMVSTNNKGRFEYNDNKTKIRACQGHSIKTLEVYKDWKIFVPDSDLYHGTATKSVDQILKSKLISKTRTHVHLSKDLETAYNVGARHGTPVILKIDAVKMQKDGFKFYESKNGVVLVDEVPNRYIQVIF
jgi:putative RNA 2'-phosphotransferase